MRVVIVDTDSEFRQGLVSQLRRWNFDSAGMPNAPALYRDLVVHPCDTVVLASDLPGENGYSVARYLRAANRIGIVMLSTEATIERRLECLTSGADACLVKPVDLRELVATLHSVNQRVHPWPEAVSAPGDEAGHWTLLTHSWQLVAPTGARIALTAHEYALLALLVGRKGAVASRREIIGEFGLDYRHYDERRLEAIVSRLRRKLEPHQGEAKPLQTAHGFGYAFTAPTSMCSGLARSARERPIDPPGGAQRGGACAAPRAAPAAGTRHGEALALAQGEA